jgi:guanylate kinase
MSDNRLVVLSGPSCVGKSPLTRALARFHPSLGRALDTLILFNSRTPRPGESDGVDYHFRSREEIEALDTQDRYVRLEVRGDLQALDLEQLERQLTQSDVLFEGNPFVGCLLISHPRLTQVRRLSVFMSPLSRCEIQYLSAPERHVSLPDFVTDVMRRKLLRRTRRQKGELSLRDLENIEKRASSAYRELQDAWRFDSVIPNHDGEDSDNWESFYFPLGEARKALDAFVDLLEGRQTSHVEKWGPDLFGSAAPMSDPPTTP